MPVAFETNSTEPSAFGQGMWIYNPSHDSSSSSSIGNNTDASGGGEVQSLFEGSLNNLCHLEDALPVKKGILTFYAGKSKSYTSLADAVSVPSIQDIVKP